MIRSICFATVAVIYAVAQTSEVVMTDSMTNADANTSDTGAFDPLAHWLNIRIGNCVIADMSSKDAYVFLNGVTSFLMDSCDLNTKVQHISDVEGYCSLDLKAETAGDAATLASCFSEPQDYTYMEMSYPVSIEGMAYGPISVGPTVMKDLRTRLEEGLPSSLTEDSSIVTVTLDRKYDDITNTFDDMTAYLDVFVTDVNGMLANKGSTGEVDIVGITKDPETGHTQLLLRAVDVDSLSEDNAMSILKELSSDPSSGLNTLAGVTAVTTTVAPTTETQETTTESSEDDSTDGTDWPLVGGLIGGVGGLALLGGGATYYAISNKKKGDSLDPAEVEAEPVYTPNTKHGVEGTLIDRTPRVVNNFD
eukprot:GHVH01007799.1.p1 GENE.GHVH01007799.1~~GHVH01007799.1.p1  ORF type:complete len:364 (-),score=46.66 GHVH01007799.1:69-1160(-)